MKKRIMAFCMAIMLCLTGISDYVISKAEDSLRQNAAKGAKISYNRGTDDISKMIDGVTAGDIPNLGIIGAENNETLETDIMVEFGGSYQIDTVRLYGDSRGYCFPKDFTIDAFSGGEWKTVCTVTDAEPVQDGNGYSFEKTDCTAIRLHITKNTKDETITDREAYAIYLSELEAWGMAISDNIALASKGTIASTSDYNEWAEGNNPDGTPVGYGIANVNDGLAGDDQKFFMTAMNPDYQYKVMKVFLVFPNTYEVDKVGLQTSIHKVFPEDFEIRAYTALGWQTVVTKTGYNSKEGMNYFEFDTVDCSAVALVTTKNRSAKGADGITDEYGIHLSEFEVYGKKASMEVPAPDMRRSNVALAKGTTVSTNYNSDWADKEGYGIANLNDGKTDKTFMTAGDPTYENEKMEVLLEFPETYRVDTVRLYKWENATLPVDFEIQAYNTESGWQTVVTQTGYETKDGWNDFKFPAVDCTRVRLVTTRNGLDKGANHYGVFIKEFEVYGIKTPFNVALAENGTTAITSLPNKWAEGNNPDGTPVGYGIANVNDGFAGNEYPYFMTAMGLSYQDAEMKVFLEFAKTYQVDKVRLHPGRDGAFPVSFEIRAYTASGWQTVVKKTGYVASGGWNEFQFTPVDCRAVALVTAENGLADPNYGIHLSEFEVWGIDVETTVSAPNLEEECINSVEAMIERLDVTAADKWGVIGDIDYWCGLFGAENIVNYGQFISKKSELDPMVIPYSKEDYEKLKNEKQAPSEKGYVFTGWFTSDDVVTEDGMKSHVLQDGMALADDATVYARFVGETMLDVKAQVSSNTTAESSTASIRFLTTVDNLAYRKIGFEIGINGKVKDTANNTVYKQLNDTYINGVKKIIKPDFFHKNAKYFKAATINNIPKDKFDTEITVTPYFETLDGTVVKGKTVTKTVARGIAAAQMNGK